MLACHFHCLIRNHSGEIVITDLQIHTYTQQLAITMSTGPQPTKALIMINTCIL